MKYIIEGKEASVDLREVRIVESERHAAVASEITSLTVTPTVPIIKGPSHLHGKWAPPKLFSLPKAL